MKLNTVSYEFMTKAYLKKMWTNQTYIPTYYILHVLSKMFHMWKWTYALILYRLSYKNLSNINEC